MKSNLLRRLSIATAFAVTAGAALAGCSSDTSTTVAEEAPDQLSGTVSLWHFFTGREAEVLKGVVEKFEEANPDVTVEIHDGQDDDKMKKAITSGQNIDVGISYDMSIVGSFCSSGAFRDLTPYIERDGVDLDDIPVAPRSYTAYEDVQCTLPMLADASALYYNTALFEAAGISSPPQTLDELKEDALKLTTYNDDGSIKSLGFNPLMGFYENSDANWATMIDGSWLDDDGKSTIGTSESWKDLIEWQKAFVDEIGYDKLKAFTSGLGQEFAGDNAFQTGQVAMMIDGEFRTAFIADQTPDLPYGVAPTPVMEGYGNYGATYTAGNVAGIAKGSKNPELAWALLKYLTTDTAAQVELANGLKNVPTLTSALESPDLQVDDNYRVFIDAAKNPNTITAPVTVGGSSGSLFATMWDDYQTNGGDLDAALKKLDEDIDNQNALNGP